MDAAKTEQPPKMASLGIQKPKPSGTTKWATTLRFGKIKGTSKIAVTSMKSPGDVVRCKNFYAV